MYKNELPNQGDTVTVTITKVDNCIAYGNLLEYNNVEAVIILSQLTKKRVRSIRKYIYPNKTDVYFVSSINNKTIILNRYHLTADEITKQNNKYIKSNKVHNMMIYVCNNTKTNITEIYEKCIWPLYEEYGHALTGLKKIADNNELLNKYDISNEVKSEIINCMNKYMVLCHKNITKKIELTCFSYKGIKAIIESLKAGENLMNELNKNNKLLANIENNFKIQYLGAPIYEVNAIFTHDLSDKKCNETMYSIFNVIESVIQKYKGRFTIR